MLSKLILAALLSGAVIFIATGKTQQQSSVTHATHGDMQTKPLLVNIKYRGVLDVNNGHFSKLSLKYSSFVNSMFYDESNQYLIVQLKSKYYHYCNIPEAVVSEWVGSSSLGRYYNQNIKGNYSCENVVVPQY